MEHLIRVQNERDRQVLRWLEQVVGPEAIRVAVAKIPGPGKPWVSQVCRHLKLQVPKRPIASSPATSVGDQHLAMIRRLLCADIPR